RRVVELLVWLRDRLRRERPRRYFDGTHLGLRDRHTKHSWLVAGSGDFERLLARVHGDALLECAPRNLDRAASDDRARRRARIDVHDDAREACLDLFHENADLGLHVVEPSITREVARRREVLEGSPVALELFFAAPEIHQRAWIG